MRFGFALMPLAMVAAAPAASQSGAVTYPTPGDPTYTSVTINYNTETITWHSANGLDYTEAPSSSFDQRATFVVYMYGSRSPTPRVNLPLGK